MIAERDINQVLRVLEGQAWKMARRVPKDEATWNAIERDPVATSLIIHVNQHGDYDGPTRDLYGMLMHPAIQSRLMSLSSKYPANTQAFSRRLAVMIPVLKTIGLDIKIDRTQTARTCSVKMVHTLFIREPDASCVIPSLGENAHRFPQAGNRPGNDGTDAISRRPNNTETDMVDLLGQIQAVREEPRCQTA